MADDRETILKRIHQSLVSHSDELQTVADELEGDEDASNLPVFEALQDAIKGIDAAREKLGGLVVADDE